MEGFRCSFLVFLTLALAASFPLTANAHTIFTTLFINDVSQGDGTCVRMNTDPEHCTSPVPSVTSDDMACGINGEQPVAFTCPAPVGAKLTFQWRLWADAEQPGVIDISHKGPCAVYAKQMTNMSAEDAAAGPGWIKLWDEGYDAGAGKWCTEKLIDSGGLLSVAVPASLPPGSSWLFRPELLALHNAAAGDPQFYVGCAQVYITAAPSSSSSSSSSSSDAPATAVQTDPGVLALPAGKSVSIPGYLRASDPGLTFDIYAPSFPYPIPGPDVYIPSSSSFSSSLSPLSSPPPLVPPSSSYLIKNANWVGRELDAYATEEGCWAALEACWARAGACYGAAPPTGSANCRAWEGRCEEVQDACAAGDFRGPPRAGRKLASQEPAPPAPEDIPPAVNANANAAG
ncbi:glycosyl hydrolase family 61-domain-containing protein [Biscogniauxia mediterranea]|nr:glycosyl hydrolase family 61-domain-containing protein [Biscogniauxia mediterranea]